jgi:GMP synthase-like glutamine amidotransferase
MRIGLLLCDHVQPELRVVAGDYLAFFERLLPGEEIVVYDLATGDFPADLNDCDGWITSGSRRSVYDDVDWIARFAGLVRTLHADGRRLVGICFGAQMIAHALGGSVGPAATGWAVGIKEVEVLTREAWMDPAVASFRILHSNADQIGSLPPSARLLGRAPGVPVSVLAVGDHIIGFQGHPEFSPAYSAVLMEARRSTLIPETVVQAGLDSLRQPPDTELLGSWISRFFANPL